VRQRDAAIAHLPRRGDEPVVGVLVRERLQPAKDVVLSVTPDLIEPIEQHQAPARLEHLLQEAFEERLVRVDAALLEVARQGPRDGGRSAQRGPKLRQPADAHQQGQQVSGLSQRVMGCQGPLCSHHREPLEQGGLAGAWLTQDDEARVPPEGLGEQQPLGGGSRHVPLHGLDAGDDEDGVDVQARRRLAMKPETDVAQASDFWTLQIPAEALLEPCLRARRRGRRRRR